MRNCLILGSGRSGTSMVAGSLASSGYHMGAGLHAARASNPKGFFEAPEINQLNEELLDGRLDGTPALGEGQRWLGVPRGDARFVADDALRARMQAALASGPWCYKDPRFSFTLPAWRPLLGDAALVCVFRHPARTALSLVEETRRASYLADVDFGVADALRLWTATYRAVLAEADRGGDWLFLHYDQALEAEGRERLARFLDARIDASFADRHLRRELPDLAVPREALALYDELCRRAGFTPAEERPADASAPPEVSVLCLVEAHERAHVAELVEDVRAQRGVRCELVLVDRGGPEPLACADATVVRCDHPSRGVAWKQALEAARGALVALQLPGCRLLPARLAHARAAFTDGIDLVTCDAALTDAQGQFVDRTFLEHMAGEPGPYFESGLVLRRAALSELADTAYAPVERALYTRLAAAGRAAHVEEPGVTLDAERYRAAWDRSREDVLLVALADAPYAGERPRLTVSLCTYQRRDVLAECVESFARQLLAPGTFELVLVDDGATDGTREYVDRLELPIPLRVVHRENGGLAAARNSGLAVARGELVLLVNDDTIAAPDLVEAHLAAHERLAGAKVCVLGTFEQPQAALDNALMRYLEHSTEVFDYARLKPGPLDGLHFYTCNVSAPLDAIRAVGGYDPSFRHYGCEDTDLGLRLEAAGYVVHFDPRARAEHRHLMGFEDLRRRQLTVSRAFVRLFRKHPAMIARWNVGHMSQENLATGLAGAAAQREQLEAVARDLSALDVGRLERVGGLHAELAAAAVTRLGETIHAINGAWWAQGYLDGQREHGLARFDDLCAEPSERLRVRSSSGRALLAWPRWDDAAALDELLRRVEPAAVDGFATLVLVHDARRDGDANAGLAALRAAAGRVFASEPPLEIEVLSEAPVGADAYALARSVNALLPLGGEPEAFLREVGCERLGSAAEVASWRERFEGAAPLPPAAPRAAGVPELTVIVPTHDRARELEGLLDALALQSLSPDRFEVIVVDDASAVPASGVLAHRDDPYALTVLRQEGGGPGVARNRAAARARGELLVFFNDDAVPAPDCLRRHRDAWRRARTPQMVMGTFDLLPEHVRDSFALLVQRSIELFPQPAMRPGILYDGFTWCSGNASLPRAAFEAVGGFDESFPYAGGEDTELGLRLERVAGMRTLYDTSIRSDHDHDLNVLQLARRKRVVGWAIHRMAELHPEARLAEPGELEEIDWEEVRAQIRAEEAELTQLIELLQQFCRRERSSGLRPEGLTDLPELVARIGAIERRRGLLCAHDGVLPSALRPEYTPPLATLQPAPRAALPTPASGPAARAAASEA
ncbi:MAG: glycosyltransferase [Planctomycetes bacterium]|nr:glycosyltransferase [Planctomycetota bacterium]